MALKFTTSYLEDGLGVFHYYKRLADGAMSQPSDKTLSDAEWSEIFDRCRCMSVVCQMER
jgi:hypothetical protein